MKAAFWKVLYYWLERIVIDKHLGSLPVPGAGRSEINNISKTITQTIFMSILLCLASFLS